MRAILRKYGIFLALAAAVILSVLLFATYRGGNKAELEILIGRPVEAAETAAVDFTHSPRLSKKAANNILLALLSSRALPDQAAPDTPPDAVMMIRSDGLGYLYSAWAGESGLIYAAQTGDGAADYRAASLPDEELALFADIHE